jgi:hypothetical protein
MRWPLVFAFFLALAVVQTWPLAMHMGDHTIAWQGDSYVMWWNFGWVKHSLLNLSNPFHTDALFAPQGTDLYLHTLNPVNAVLAMPLLLITDNVLLSWNILMLTYIALSGTGGYALCYHVTKDRWASLLGGFVFAFAPHVMMQMNASHQNIAAAWPIPFFALCLLRFFETRSKRDLIFAAVLGAVMTWNWLEFAIDAGLLGVVMFGFWAAIKTYRGERASVLPMVRSLLPGVALWAVLSAPILIMTALAISSGDYTVTNSGGEANYFSPDVTAYFIPSPLWGPGEHSNNYLQTYSTRAGSIETTMYLGFVPLILAAVAIGYRRTSRLRTSIKFWSIVFAFFAVLALGPQLHLMAADFPIPLPFRLLELVPLIGERRVPGRMIIVGMLALGILATIGISALAARYSPRLKNAGPIFVCIALAVVFVEYWNSPVGLASYNVPPIYEQIAAEDGEFAVLDLPLGRVTGNRRAGDPLGGAMSDYAQSIHGKDDIGGYLSRVEDENLEWLAKQPGLGYLACLDCEDYPRAMDEDTARVRALFDELRIKYVVINLVSFEGDPTVLTTEGTAAEAESYVAGLGLEKVGSGEGWLAYRNPDVE